MAMVGLLFAVVIGGLSVAVASVRLRSFGWVIVLLALHVALSTTAFVWSILVYSDRDTTIFVLLTLGPGAVLATVRSLYLVISRAEGASRNNSRGQGRSD